MASSIDIQTTKTNMEVVEPNSTSLLSAIKAKYCTPPKEYYVPDMIHAQREIKVIAGSRRPGAFPVQDVRTFILESSHISKAGSSDEIQSLCQKARELHLGHNDISEWDTVLSIIMSIPSLIFLDLNHNPLLSPASLPTMAATAHSTLSVLILSGTGVPFEQVSDVLQYLPSVSELHLSKNDYTDGQLCISKDYTKHIGMKLVHFVSNNITEWQSVETVGKVFPNLETLLVSYNPLNNVTKSGEYFNNLHCLNLNNTSINSWDSLESILKFPKLKSLSLWHAPIGDELNEKERRYAIISRLPFIEQLNKSSISETEREDSERWLVRQYKKKPKRPSVYEELSKKHGNLDPLPDIDLSPKTEISLELTYENIEKRSEVHSVSTEQTTKQLRSWVGRSLLGISPSRVMLVYVDYEEDTVYDTVTMKVDSKPLYYYKMKDGDKITIIVLD